MEVIARHAKKLVSEVLNDTPIAIIQGARQVGKSTLAQEVLRDRAGRYVSLDDPIYRAAAAADPISFVEQSREGCLCIDEVQRMPALVLAIKSSVDRNRSPGRFLLTGSANLLRMPLTGDSLAGRAETIHLLGLSQGERNGQIEHFIDRAFDGDSFLEGSSSLCRTDYLDLVCRGGYPEVTARVTPRRRAAWFRNYLERITSIDAAMVAHLQRVDLLPRLVHLFATHSASIVSKATIAREVGLPETTLPAYLDLLETLYLIHRIPAWSNSLSGRVTKAPKYFLADSGLAASLLNVSASSLDIVVNPDLAGPLIETFVMSELREQCAHSDVTPQFFHWRDRTGAEVDIVLEAGDGKVIALEIKASSTVGKSDFKWLSVLRDKLGDRFVGGFVLYTGTEVIPWGDRLRAMPISSIWERST